MVCLINIIAAKIKTIFEKCKHSYILFANMSNLCPQIVCLNQITARFDQNIVGMNMV